MVEELLYFLSRVPVGVELVWKDSEDGFFPIKSYDKCLYLEVSLPSLLRTFMLLCMRGNLRKIFYN